MLLWPNILQQLQEAQRVPALFQSLLLLALLNTI